MLPLLRIVQLVACLGGLTLSGYGISQAVFMRPSSYEHLGKAAVAFLLVYMCVLVFRATQRRIDLAEYTEDPNAFAWRKTREAAERLGDLSHLGPKTAREQVEAELDRIEEEIEEVRIRASRTPSTGSHHAQNRN